MHIAIDPHQTSPRVRRVAVDPPLTMWVLSFDFPDNPAYSFTHHPYSVSSIHDRRNLQLLNTHFRPQKKKLMAIKVVRTLFD